MNRLPQPPVTLLWECAAFLFGHSLRSYLCHAAACCVSMLSLLPWWVGLLPCSPERSYQALRANYLFSDLEDVTVNFIYNLTWGYQESSGEIVNNLIVMGARRVKRTRTSSWCTANGYGRTDRLPAGTTVSLTSTQREREPLWHPRLELLHGSDTVCDGLTAAFSNSSSPHGTDFITFSDYLSLCDSWVFMCPKASPTSPLVTDWLCLSLAGYLALIAEVP